MTVCRRLSFGRAVFVIFYFIAGSRRARNLVCTPYLDLGAKLFGQNRSINPRKPIRIHFHANKNILKDDRRNGQCARSSKPKFCIIEVLI